MIEVEGVAVTVNDVVDSGEIVDPVVVTGIETLDSELLIVDWLENVSVLIEVEGVAVTVKDVVDSGEIVDPVVVTGIETRLSVDRS